MTHRAEPSVVVVTRRQDPAFLTRIFAPAFPTVALGGAAEARAALADQSPDLVLIEDEAGLDGPALIRDLKQRPHLGATSIMLIAGGDAEETRRRGLEAGATDVIVPPLDGVDLQIRGRNLVALARAQARATAHGRDMALQVEAAAADSRDREREIIHRLMLAAEFRDDQAGDHLTRVAACVIAIADGLGLSEAEANDIALASTMHDIGKIGVADSILRKPGPLSDAERTEMMQHALRGYQMLNGSPSRLLRMAAEIALTHHERWDGTGYPQGLKGEAIPLAGRITAVADVFDALISARPYKQGWPLDRARRFLEEQSGSHFDPACVDAFLSRWDEIVGLVEERPVGRAA
ncbi:HD domain-containing phosphohydrolase [uncultured Methylobacterium sp.]|jgi:putative two-component system response regulator|uniref:HD-GYP domain-containing protein n=1 Tax=uncultured Methylobacterium sp. TaxID=157278 RepID=UPI002639C21B|nr:HD domain-containing phosphohydrolase [uncultured Methylobacterium sp.]